MVGLDIAYRGRGLVSGSFGPVHLVATFATATLEDVHGAADVHSALIRRYPEGTVSLSLLTTSVNLPADVRAASTQRLLANAPHTRALALVLPGGGLASSITRSVMTAVFILSRPACPTRIVQSRDTAVAWLVQSLASPELTQEALLGALGLLEREVDGLEARLQR